MSDYDPTGNDFNYVHPRLRNTPEKHATKDLIRGALFSCVSEADRATRAVDVLKAATGVEDRPCHHTPDSDEVRPRRYRDALEECRERGVPDPYF